MSRLRILSRLSVRLTLLAATATLAQAPTADPHAHARPAAQNAAAQSGNSSVDAGRRAAGLTGSAAVAQKCASCHASQALSQPLTPMGRALQLPATNPTLKEHPLLSFHSGAYTYTIKTAGENSTYSVTDGAQTISLPIKWTMGVGGQTWVLERNGKLYESLVSFYPAISGLDITTGDEILKPASLEEAMGREISKEDSRACFGCHATNSVVNGRLSLETLQPGITCQHCHDGALLHAADAEQGAFDTAPPKLGQMSSEKISNYCGQCHRTWETVVRNRWHGPVNVRFPAYRIANSRCFDGKDPRISCVACHDPHQNVPRTAVAYDAKCLACHAPAIAISSVGPAVRPAALQSNVDAFAGREHAKVCPVAKTNCTSCHMPKVVFPGGGGHLTFTDHDIRIVKPGDAYPD